MNTIVVAHDLNRAIGFEGKLPWDGLIPEDLKRFRAVTMGRTVLMGRATYDSIGRPLPGRHNVVVSRTQHAIDGCDVVGDLTTQLEHGDNFVIGGAQIYEQSLPYCSRVLATIVQTSSKHADTYFPDLDLEWELVSQEHFPADSKNKLAMQFVEYARIR